ncbi:hypothetical protein H9P43_003032 [Blastocladiella emersonii ATCC 22665]|nr:hypothetical protein H9P43_003032 [Blastocladiella emersonii ATCC 22665]
MNRRSNPAQPPPPPPAAIMTPKRTSAHSTEHILRDILANVSRFGDRLPGASPRSKHPRTYDAEMLQAEATALGSRLAQDASETRAREFLDFVRELRSRTKARVQELTLQDGRAHKLIFAVLGMLRMVIEAWVQDSSPFVFSRQQWEGPWGIALDGTIELIHELVNMPGVDDFAAYQLIGELCVQVTVQHDLPTPAKYQAAETLNGLTTTSRDHGGKIKRALRRTALHSIAKALEGAADSQLQIELMETIYRVLPARNRDSYLVGLFHDPAWIDFFRVVEGEQFSELSRRQCLDINAAHTATSRDVSDYPMTLLLAAAAMFVGRDTIALKTNEPIYFDAGIDRVTVVGTRTPSRPRGSQSVPDDIEFCIDISYFSITGLGMDRASLSVEIKQMWSQSPFDAGTPGQRRTMVKFLDELSMNKAIVSLRTHCPSLGWAAKDLSAPDRPVSVANGGGEGAVADGIKFSNTAASLKLHPTAMSPSTYHDRASEYIQPYTADADEVGPSIVSAPAAMGNGNGHVHASSAAAATSSHDEGSDLDLSPHDLSSAPVTPALEPVAGPHPPSPGGASRPATAPRPAPAIHDDNDDGRDFHYADLAAPAADQDVGDTAGRITEITGDASPIVHAPRAKRRRRGSGSDVESVPPPSPPAPTRTRAARAAAAAASAAAASKPTRSSPATPAVAAAASSPAQQQQRRSTKRRAASPPPPPAAPPKRARATHTPPAAPPSPRASKPTSARPEVDKAGLIDFASLVKHRTASRPTTTGSVPRLHPRRSPSPPPAREDDAFEMADAEPIPQPRPQSPRVVAHHEQQHRIGEFTSAAPGVTTVPPPPAAPPVPAPPTSTADELKLIKDQLNQLFGMMQQQQQQQAPPRSSFLAAPPPIAAAPVAVGGPPAFATPWTTRSEPETPFRFHRGPAAAVGAGLGTAAQLPTPATSSVFGGSVSGAGEKRGWSTAFGAAAAKEPATAPRRPGGMSFLATPAPSRRESLAGPASASRTAAWTTPSRFGAAAATTASRYPATTLLPHRPLHELFAWTAHPSRPGSGGGLGGFISEHDRHAYPPLPVDPIESAFAAVAVDAVDRVHDECEANREEFAGLTATVAESVQEWAGRWSTEVAQEIAGHVREAGAAGKGGAAVGDAVDKLREALRASKL